MPTILEHATAFALLKKAVIAWCRVVGGWLNLDAYLLPANVLHDQPEVNVPPLNLPLPNPEGNNRQEDNLAARHHAFLLIREPTHIEAYEKPRLFPLRIVALLGCLAITAVAISLLFFTIPGTNILLFLIAILNLQL